MRAPILVAALLALPSVGWAQIDPKCADVEKPAGYDEQTQQDFLSNYFALATTLSPLHGPMPHEPGHGAFGVDLLLMPPLGCERRFVLDHTKTEDTNVTPLAPRPRVTFAFQSPGWGVVPYAGFAYVPPVTMFGTRNVIVGGEIGAGKQFGEHAQLGARFHAQSMKTIADVASAFEADDPVVNDLYLASTFGADLIFGFRTEVVTPYLSLGVTDASTFFYVGDDGEVANNRHPYAGPVLSLGADGLVGWLRFGGELYAAPGGHSSPDEEAVSLSPAARYGRMYTARFRIAVEL